MLYTTLVFGWVATTCLFVYLLLKLTERQAEERVAHRIEVDAQRQENAEVAKSHREEIANLLQRIQAPEVAVANHVAATFQDPPQPDLDDDEALLELRERERELQEFGMIP